MAIPLCLPNNYRWNASTGECSNTGEKRSSLVIVDEALQKLKILKGPVCVVSITGPYRTGKSFILSEVFCQPEVFPLGHSLDAVTMGIWMWIAPEKFLDSNGQECSIVLLDCEGIRNVKGGDADENQIFTLTVLLSSVLIYNSTAVPMRDDCTNLDFIVNLSQRIKLRSSSEGQPSMAARKDDAEYFHKTFPFFIWLLRNVTQDIPSNCKDLKEYFLSRVFQDQSSSNEGTVHKFAASILCFFSGFEAFHLPPPSSDLEVLKNMAKNKSKLSTAFLNGVQKFKVSLQSVLKAKDSFSDGDIVTGEGLAALVRHYVDAINTPGMVLNVQTAWENFVVTKCSEAFKGSCNLFKETMTAELSGKLPCDNDVIRKKQEMAFQKGLALFEDETFGIAATTRKTYLKEFMKFEKALVESWLQENGHLTSLACDALLKDLEKEHLDPVLKRLHGKRGAEMSFHDIIQGYERIKEEFLNRAIGAKDVHAAVFYEFHPTLIEKMTGNLRLLEKLKDFDERKGKEIAARAYQGLEIRKLQEQRAQVQQEKRELQIEMEKQNRRLDEEIKRLKLKMAADAKDQEQRMVNMVTACMGKVEEYREALMRDNQVREELLEEMERFKQEMEQRIGDLNERLREIQNNEREVREPDYLDRALRIVSGLATVSPAVTTIASACIVM